MSPLEALLVFFAGIGAGAINAVVGSGTLITFPVLLAVGYPAVTANVSNAIGLVPGSVVGAIGYRDLLTGQRERAIRLGVVAFVGGTAGAIGLLLLPPGIFEAIVPAFIAFALVLIVFQTRLSAWFEARRTAATPAGGGKLTTIGMGVASAYGGYFGAAQGIIYVAILSTTLKEDLQRINALKNVLAAIVNGVAGVVFVIAAHVAWLPVLLIALGSALGGQLGARYGKRLPPGALRAIIVVVGVVAIVNLLT